MSEESDKADQADKDLCHAVPWEQLQLEEDQPNQECVNPYNNSHFRYSLSIFYLTG